MDNVIICIPTYRRKWPSILSCVRLNSSLTFHMFVRKKDYDDGYYNCEQFKISNLKLIPMTDVDEIGMTREKMLEYAIEHHYKYCMQIDDSQFGLQDIYGKIFWLEDIIKTCINELEKDKNYDRIFCINFARKIDGNKIGINYFFKQMVQTFIINCDVCKKYNLHFDNIHDCGLEDILFAIRAVDKGLIEFTDSRFIRIGRPGSIKGEVGGCHDTDGDKYIAINKAKTDKLIEYIENAKDISDKKLLLAKPSVWYPGTFCCQLNTNYAKEKLL